MSPLNKFWNSTSECNILLLGETGVGKSTSINAFANYIKYVKINDAIKNKFETKIPCKFVLTDPTTFKRVDIVSGKDDNEDDRPGKSKTKKPKTHTLNYNNKIIKLIDTPGIGDTDGIDQDIENFDQILQMLHCFKQLHGIIIFMKSTLNRHSSSFKYCFSELLTQLHKSASENIVICFTYSRNSCFGPGDAFQTLQTFLETDLEEAKLNLTPGENCFFIDNEAYRFLVAQKQGIKFPDNQFKQFNDSWDNSVAQTIKMFEKIIGKKPHDLDGTISLNKARKLIYIFAEPMVMLQSQMNDNIAHIKDEEDKLRNSNENKMKLAQNLYVEKDELEQIPLEYPSTVCGSCVQHVSFNDVHKINYTQRCHEKCGLTGVAVNSVGDPQLKYCWAMDSKGEKCRFCRCNWQQHLHLECTYKVVKRPVIDQSRQKDVKSLEDAIGNIDNAIKDLQTTLREMQREMTIIEDIASKFAYTLIEHSNTPYNKFIEPYFDLLINEEKMKINSRKGYSNDKQKELENMKAAHLKKVEILKDAINNSSYCPVQISDVNKYCDQLISLKQTGAQFEKMLKNTEYMTNNKILQGAIQILKMDQNLKKENRVHNTHESELFTVRYSEAEKCNGKFTEFLEKSNKDAIEKFEQQQQMLHYQQNQLLSATSETERDDFMPQQKSPNELNANLIDPNLPQYNILLLGETGAGKSTTINALANYVKYVNFDRATNANLIELISTSFNLTNPKTNKSFPINSGNDKNECLTNIGASRTQEPVAYRFVYHDKLVRIIDTPGMGDTRGMMVDKQNFDLILNYLTYYKELHAICVLIKSDETKKTASFRYCITELLTRLHRNACKNIIFCFTFSRNDFYAPGDGFVMLEEFLKKELPEVGIKLEAGTNCFFIDNEAYRFLVAKKCGYPFKSSQIISYRDSWVNSVDQTNKMIEKIINLYPHNLEETLELNRSGKLIVKLAQPLMRLQINLSQNCQQISKEKFNSQNLIQSTNDLEDILNINLYDLVINPLEFPVTVCSSSKCVERINRDNYFDIYYSTHCHENCTEIEIDVDTIGHELMRKCTAMGGKSKCNSCGCSWKEHMRLTVDYSLVEKKLIDPQIIEEIKNKEHFRAKFNMLSRHLKQIQDDFVAELNTIQEICSVFGYLLEKYSNTSLNRFTDSHLDMLISEEQAKIQRNKYHPNDEFLNLKKSQVSKIEKFTETVNSPSYQLVVELSDVKELCDKLIGLKLNGMQIKQLIETLNSNNQRQKERVERLAVNLKSN